MEKVFGIRTELENRKFTGSDDLIGSERHLISINLKTYLIANFWKGNNSRWWYGRISHVC